MWEPTTLFSVNFNGLVNDKSENVCNQFSCIMILIRIVECQNINKLKSAGVQLIIKFPIVLTDMRMGTKVNNMGNLIFFQDMIHQFLISDISLYQYVVFVTFEGFRMLMARTIINLKKQNKQDDHLKQYILSRYTCTLRIPRKLTCSDNICIHVEVIYYHTLTRCISDNIPQKNFIFCCLEFFFLQK